MGAEPVTLNNCSIEELRQQVDGIGEVLAASIKKEHRSTWPAVAALKGIGSERLESLRTQFSLRCVVLSLAVLVKWEFPLYQRGRSFEERQRMESRVP